MNYFEAMKFVKDNPHEEDTEDEMMGFAYPVEEDCHYDQDTPPDYDGYDDLICHEKPGDEMPPSFGPKDSPPPCAPPIQAEAPPSF